MAKQTGWRSWPRDQDGNESKGPNPKQKLLWFEEMQKAQAEGKLPPGSIHTHNRSIDLSIGGTRSGKTTGAVSRLAAVARRYPGAKMLVGATDFGKLKTTVILDYQELFSKNTAWDHPCVKQAPDDRHKYLLLGNGHNRPDSIIYFRNLQEKKGEGILGQGLDIIHIDEPQLLNHFENMLDASFTRLSNRAVPFKQIILTANPTSNLSQIRRRFELQQFEEGYAEKGGKPVPIGNPCECNFCSQCRLSKNGAIKVDYVDGVCPVCGTIKKNKCLGGQHYYRVIFSSAEDNIDYLPDGYQQDMETGMGEEASKKFGLGVIVQNKGGACYPKFNSANVRASNIDFDLSRDIVWSLDLNQRPQSSVLYQKRILEKRAFIDVIDEIAKFDADIFDVADIFIERFGFLIAQNFPNRIILRGDPMMHTGAYVRDGELKTKDKFEVLARRLKRAGFRCEIMQPQTKYPIKERIECANYNFRDEDNISRVQINPHCKWLIASAEQSVWNNKETEESKAEDDRVLRSGRDGVVYGTTHHMAAFGYGLLQDSPMIRRNDFSPVMVAANGNIITIDSDGKYVEKTLAQLEREGEDEDIEYEGDDELDYPLEVVEEDTSSPSLADQLHRRGLWNLNRSW